MRDWQDEGVLIDQLGHASSESPAYEMTDAEVLAYQDERRQREARRIPAGFRAEASTLYWLTRRRPGTFPQVTFHV